MMMTMMITTDLHIDSNSIETCVHDGDPAVFRRQYEQRHQRLQHRRQR